MHPLTIGSDYSRHPIPGQGTLGVRLPGEVNVYPHADYCACSTCDPALARIAAQERFHAAASRHSKPNRSYPNA